MWFLSSPMILQFRLQSDFNSASALAGVLPVPRAVQLAYGRAARALYLFEAALNKTSLLTSTACQKNYQNCT